jgi:hypothetical protein
VNARTEAFERLGGKFEVRVLEPSPPTDVAPPWFADDPVAVGDVPAGRKVVSPVPNADLTWDDLAVDDDLRDWCAERWLGAWGRLPPYSDAAASVLEPLHALAEHVLAPARYRANGKIGLRFTRGGFGTPFYADDRQVRVEGAELIVQEGDTERREGITNLLAAAECVGIPCAPVSELYVPATSPDVGAPLDIAESGVSFFAAWFGFAAYILEQLRFSFPDSAMSSRVQLWPEHFDMSLEAGDEGAGTRASYGASPADAQHAEPYLYVSPWTSVPTADCWNDVHFGGACLPYSELVGAEDQREAALAFFTTAFVTLNGSVATG